MPSHDVVPWLFLAVTLIGAGFTFNAYFPRRTQSLLIVPSFFAGWLTSELAAHHFAWQVLATVVFVWAGALAAWPGWLGLAITLASWAALLALVPLSRQSETIVEKALTDALGADYRKESDSDAHRSRDSGARGQSREKESDSDAHRSRDSGARGQSREKESDSDAHRSRDSGARGQSREKESDSDAHRSRDSGARGQSREKESDSDAHRSRDSGARGQSREKESDSDAHRSRDSGARGQSREKESDSDAHRSRDSGARGQSREKELPAEEATRRFGSSRRSRVVVPFLLYDSEVRVTRNVRYAPEAERRHLLDVYAPRGGCSGAPVLLQVHGGGWVIGDKREQALPLMLHLAARGWVCVAANYRLSPRATFPDHLVDLKLAIRWIRDNIAEHGGDPDFLAVTGGSAGGHLSALVGLTANDPEYQPGFEDVDTSVRAAVPFYGVYDFANRFGHSHFDGFEQFLGRFVLKTRFADNPEAFHKASPVDRVHADAPPFFVIHGTHDSLAPVDEGRRFVERLREVSHAPVAYAEIPGAQHAFEVFHSLRTRHVVQGVERFLAWVHAGYLAERRIDQRQTMPAAEELLRSGT